MGKRKSDSHDLNPSRLRIAVVLRSSSKIARPHRLRPWETAFSPGIATENLQHHLIDARDHVCLTNLFPRASLPETDAKGGVAQRVLVPYLALAIVYDYIVLSPSSLLKKVVSAVRYG
jgi:hypothetical protein